MGMPGPESDLKALRATKLDILKEALEYPSNPARRSPFGGRRFIWGNANFIEAPAAHDTQGSQRYLGRAGAQWGCHPLACSGFEAVFDNGHCPTGSRHERMSTLPVTLTEAEKGKS